MNIYDRYKIVNYHKKRKGGGKLHSLGWRSEESQSARYEILRDITDYSNKSVLEPGCGYGDFLFFLEEKYKNFKYTGIEMVSGFIDEVPEKFKENSNYNFIKGDFSKLTFPGYDIVAASGVLSYSVFDKQYYKNMIKKMFDLASEAAAFNFLDQKLFGEHPLLKAHDKNKLIEYSLSLTQNCKTFDNYLQDDVTIVLFK
ncbi:MAG: class I SAM-dependent methyltransferase [Rhodothermaceae bacterium]